MLPLLPFVSGLGSCGGRQRQTLQPHQEELLFLTHPQSMKFDSCHHVGMVLIPFSPPAAGRVSGHGGHRSSCVWRLVTRSAGKSTVQWRRCSCERRGLNGTQTRDSTPWPAQAAGFLRSLPAWQPTCQLCELSTLQPGSLAVKAAAALPRHSMRSVWKTCSGASWRSK